MALGPTRLTDHDCYIQVDKLLDKRNSSCLTSDLHSYLLEDSEFSLYIFLFVCLFVFLHDGEVINNSGINTALTNLF